MVVTTKLSTHRWDRRQLLQSAKPSRESVTDMSYCFVVIGRNEGARLQRCIASLPPEAAVVYVDSGSTDGSAQWARDSGINVLELDLSLPFTAARARNAGLTRVQVPAFEKYGEVLSGTFIALIGLVFFIWPVM